MAAHRCRSHAAAVSFPQPGLSWCVCMCVRYAFFVHRCVGVDGVCDLNYSTASCACQARCGFRVCTTTGYASVAMLPKSFASPAWQLLLVSCRHPSPAGWLLKQHAVAHMSQFKAKQTVSCCRGGVEWPDLGALLLCAVLYMEIREGSEVCWCGGVHSEGVGQSTAWWSFQAVQDHSLSALMMRMHMHREGCQFHTGGRDKNCCVCWCCVLLCLLSHMMYEIQS